MPLPPLTVFDVETTGLDPKKGHRIVELAGMRIENGKIIEEQMFHSLINPERDIPWEVKQIHGITEQDLVGAPTVMTVLPQFLSFAKGSILVAHNAAFDKGFLESEKEFCWGYIELPSFLCTMRLSQSLFPGVYGHNLDAVCQRLQITMQPGRHRAQTDVMLTGQALLKMLDAGHIQSIDELRRRAGLDAAAPVPAKPGVVGMKTSWRR